jgi:hypothetical protein
MINNSKTEILLIGFFQSNKNKVTINFNYLLANLKDSNINMIIDSRSFKSDIPLGLKGDYYPHNLSKILYNHSIEYLQAFIPSQIFNLRKKLDELKDHKYENKFEIIRTELNEPLIKLIELKSNNHKIAVLFDYWDNCGYKFWFSRYIHSNNILKEKFIFMHLLPYYFGYLKFTEYTNEDLFKYSGGRKNSLFEMFYNEAEETKKSDAMHEDAINDGNHELKSMQIDSEGSSWWNMD